MINLEGYLEKRLREVISEWDEEGIYAVSFLVCANEANEYNGYSNVTTFAVSYNTEKDCEGAPAMAEERWNYAFWRQNEVPIMDAERENEGMHLLFDWYRENGIECIGYEDPNTLYDSNQRYIGKGPIGYYELLLSVTEVAKKLQESGFIEKQLGAPVPIIIHDYEYSWTGIEATKKANTGGQAAVFLAAMKELGIAE